MSATDALHVSEFAESYLALCQTNRTPIYRRFDSFVQYDPESRTYKFHSDEDMAHMLLRVGDGVLPNEHRYYAKAVQELKLRAPRLNYFIYPQFRFYSGIFRDANYIIPLSNGLFDARRYLQGRSRFFYKRPSPRVYTCSPRSYGYHPAATCPVWEEKLVQWLDAESILLLQEWFGLCCVYDSKYEKMLVMIGPLRTGKTTTQNLLESLQGKMNVSNVGIESFGGQFSSENMIGKILNISPDVAKISGVAEAKLKAITSAERINQDRKFKKSISFTPTARLVLVGNDFPIFLDRSEALLDRMLILSFENFIPEEHRDRDLKGKLENELPGIFNWAMAGLARLTKRGHFATNDKLKAQLSELRLAINHAQEFLQEFVKPSEGAFVICPSLYQRYSNWARNNGYRPADILNASQFGKEVRRAYPHVIRQRATEPPRFWRYVGISEVFSRPHGIQYVEGTP